MATAKPKKKKAYKFPARIGTCADMLWTIRQKRLDAKKIVDELEEEEKALKNHIINNLPKSNASGIAGKLARVTAITKEVPQVEDWDKFYTFVKRHNAFYLMQKRLADTAIKELWDDGKKVPGVKAFNVTTVSMNKV